jgi:hypothetical protein
VSGGTNTGGGGGGASGIVNGAAGGSGIVVLRYPDIYTPAANVTGSPIYTVAGGYRIYTFTGTGTITFYN